MMSNSFQSLFSSKLGQVGLSCFVVFLIYIILFATKSEDFTFGIVGGWIGCICSVSFKLLLDWKIELTCGDSFRDLLSLIFISGDTMARLSN
jgi:hypothetical protein